MNAVDVSLASSVEQRIVELVKNDPELHRMLPSFGRAWQGALGYEAAKAVRTELVKRLKELR